MKDFPYIEKEEGETFYVRERNQVKEEVPLADIFADYEINGKTAEEIAENSILEEDDVHKAAYFWTSNPENYARVKQEAEKILAFNERFEQEGPEAFLSETESGLPENMEEDWFNVVGDVFSSRMAVSKYENFSINDRLQNSEDLTLEDKQNQTGKALELNFGDARVMAGTDSDDYVDFTYYLEGERQTMIRVHSEIEKVEQMAEEMVASAIYADLHN